MDWNHLANSGEGPPTDPAHGYSVDRLQADHIVPMKAMITWILCKLA